MRAMEDRGGAHAARLVTQDPDGRPWSRELGAKTLIGRGEHCDIRLDDERVSTDHAEVARHGSTYLLSDLDSRNGTLLNGRPLVGVQRLRNGDVVQIGPRRLEAQLPALVPTSRERTRSVKLSDAERSLAAALAAPFREGTSFVPRTPSYGELADELKVSQSTVKRHLVELARKLHVSADKSDDRARLVADRVIALGLDRQ
jgi:pSer/pThr/pTyr-binding forkhead associated (FHA) protein